MSSPQYPYPPQQPAQQPPYSPAPPTFGAPAYNAPPLRNSNVKTALAAGAIIASLAANCFLLFQVRDLQTLTAKNQETVQNQIDTIKENSTVMTAASKKHIDQLHDDLEARARQLNAAASQAKREAVSYADEQAKKLEQENQQTKQAVAQTNSALSDVSKRADTANAKIADVGTDVAGVKTDLASTKTDLDKTKSALTKVSGDLGITNGYVATSSKDIEELKRRGEVSIVEFSLKKQKVMQRVGDISLQLEKSDPKKNRFNVIVLADDKRVEKKDRTVGEPLQFYVSKSLYQIVVISVGKDQISGYLQTPKYQNR